MNKILNKKQRIGRRLPQNKIKVQQLKNSQYIITLPQMWAEILKVDKGSVIRFIPSKNGGVEIVKDENKHE